MNRFEIEGQVIQVTLKTSKAGRRFHLVTIETEAEEIVPFSVWGSPPEKGSRVHLSGRLTGWGDFANPKIEQIEVIRSMEGGPSPSQTSQRRRTEAKPETEHFSDDGSLPF